MIIVFHIIYKLLLEYKAGVKTTNEYIDACFITNIRFINLFTHIHAYLLILWVTAVDANSLKKRIVYLADKSS